jgi:hypothetical protein
VADNELNVIPHSRRQLYLLSVSKCFDSHAHLQEVTYYQSSQNLLQGHLPRFWAQSNPKTTSPLRLCLPMSNSSQPFVWEDVELYSQSHGDCLDWITAWQRAMMKCRSLPAHVIFSFPHSHSNVSVIAPAGHLRKVSSWPQTTLPVGRFATAVHANSSCSPAERLLYSGLCHLADDLDIALTYFTWQVKNLLLLVATALFREASKWMIDWKHSQWLLQEAFVASTRRIA